MSVGIDTEILLALTERTRTLLTAAACELEALVAELRVHLDEDKESRNDRNR